MTKKQLQKFIRVRNRSQFPSNLQFWIDLKGAGLSLSDIGAVRKVTNGVYHWKTPFGTLIEEGGQLRLEED